MKSIGEQLLEILNRETARHSNPYQAAYAVGFVERLFLPEKEILFTHYWTAAKWDGRQWVSPSQEELKKLENQIELDLDANPNYYSECPHCDEYFLSQWNALGHKVLCKNTNVHTRKKI